MTADLALLASDPTSLDLVDDPGKQIELACERANAWLKVALDHDVRIETIVETKAQAAALAAFAIQKQLGHDAELAALEVQRRAERGIGLAIRRGQETGEIARRGQGGGQPPRSQRDRIDKAISLPTEFASHAELSGNGAGIYDLTDDVAEDEFDAAIEKAKSEGNLSRANVVRKVKGEKNVSLTTAQKVTRIRELAAQGYASAQIARELGYDSARSAEVIRRLARDNTIEIPADKVIGRTRRIDSNKVVNEIVTSLAELALPMRLVDFTDLDAAQATDWANSLTESIRALNRFAKQIKELAQ